MIRKIPLAWLQLSREKTRLVIALAGIAFADILMFMQLGFRDALFDSNVRFHNGLKGDIVVINPRFNALLGMKPFSQRRLYRTLDVEEVQSVHPVYLDFTSWKNPYNGKSRSIQVVGINPATNVFDLSGVAENLDKVKLTDVAIFDRASRPEYGPIAANFNQGEDITAEVKGRRVRIEGLFTLGASFGADGNIITSDSNFFRIFENRQPGLVDIGIIKLKPGANIEAVKNRLITLFYQEVKQPPADEKEREKQKITCIDNTCYQPRDIELVSKQEFVQKEKDYWSSSTAIGFIFTLGTIMGFVVGTVIVYQILYGEVNDHLAEYATLKAMGYTQNYLLLVVFQEALILAIIGYIPGFVAGMFIYNMARGATLLPIIMTVERATLVLILTVLMCTISGSIAVRKLGAADPADIF